MCTTLQHVGLAMRELLHSVDTVRVQLPEHAHSEVRWRAEGEGIRREGGGGRTGMGVERGLGKWGGRGVR